MKILKITVILIVIFATGLSCESSTYDEITGNVVNPTYTANVKAIITNNCYPCHSVTGGTFPTMETYAQVRDAAEQGSMICRIDDQSCGPVMPQSGRMPQATINIIKKWVQDGYPN